MLRRRPLTRHGFTITEILVAAMLSLLFAALVGQVVSLTVRTSGDTLGRIEAETRAREVLRSTTSALRGAVPLGTCAEPKGQTDVRRCLRIGTYPGSTAIDTAKPDEIIFYAYANDENELNPASLETSAPARMRMYVTVEMNTTLRNDVALLQVDRSTAPSSRSYVDTPQPLTSAAWTNTRTQRLGELANLTKPTCSGSVAQIFTYYDANGRLISPDAGTCKIPVTQLNNIALVKVDAEVLYRSRLGTSGTVPIKLSSAVTISSALYAGAVG